MANNPQTQIDRIRTNVTNALTAIAAKGVTVGNDANSDDLKPLIDAIETGEVPEFAILRNLAPDSSFETGGVWGAPLVQDSTHVKYGAYAGKITGVANKAETSSTSATTVSLTAGHKYYARFEWYMESARTVEKFGFYWPIVANSAFFNSTVEGAQTGAWNSVSATHATPAESGDYPIRLDFDNAGAATTAWIDGIVLLDLTEGFGAGKEPSKEWCDQNIPYFSDTLISVIPELPELTNPAAASDIYTGKEAIDASGAKLTGTNPYNAANVDPAVTSALSAIAEKGVDTSGADLFDLASLIGSIEQGGGGGEGFVENIVPGFDAWYGTFTVAEDATEDIDVSFRDNDGTEYSAPTVCAIVSVNEAETGHISNSMYGGIGGYSMGGNAPTSVYLAYGNSSALSGTASGRSPYPFVSLGFLRFPAYQTIRAALTYFYMVVSKRG